VTKSGGRAAGERGSVSRKRSVARIGVGSKEGKKNIFQQLARGPPRKKNPKRGGGEPLQRRGEVRGAPASLAGRGILGKKTLGERGPETPGKGR